MQEVSGDGSKTTKLWTHKPPGAWSDRDEPHVTSSIPVLFTITIALNVVGQYLLKAGTGKVTLALSQWLAIITNPELLLGLAAYVVSLVTWLLLLKRLPLAVAYPTLSLSYLLIVLVGVVVLREPWSWTRVAGSAVIVLGVWLLWRPA